MKAVIEISRGRSGRLHVSIGIQDEGGTRLAGSRDGPYQVLDERIVEPEKLIAALRECADDLETRLDDERQKGGAK